MAKNKKIKLEFDEATHTYYMDGEKAPGVTSILGEFMFVDRGQWPYYISTLSGAIIDAMVMDAASDFGTAVHKVMKYVLAGVPVDYPDRIGPCVDQLLQWQADHKPEILLCEKPMGSARYGFAGTPDIFCRLDGKRLALIDVKTGIGQLTGPQTAAYEMLIRENTKHRGMIERWKLYLPKDGSPYKLTRYRSPDDWRYFQAKIIARNFEQRLLVA